MKKLRVGIYGANGHQIWNFLEGYDRVDFVASAAVPSAKLERYEKFRNKSLLLFDSLDDMLSSCELDLICLCSPVRREQAKDAIKVLRAGVSVYAEKPAALSEAELEEILEAAKQSKGEFHEIADSAFTEPYSTMQSLIKEGKIGKVVQIYAQKSYRKGFKNRPNDADVDGGLTRQAGIHAARFIEHVCGMRIKDVRTFETSLGAPEEKPDLITASSVIMTIENGGVASMCLNYFNPQSFNSWGNETVRAFGTAGMIEITDGGMRTHLYTDDGDEGEFVFTEEPKHFFKHLCEHLLDGTPMPFSRDEELSPLRTIIRAKEASRI